MCTVSQNSAISNPLCRRVYAALRAAKLDPRRDFDIEATGSTVRVTFTEEHDAGAWLALLDFDVASDGPHALRVGKLGAFARPNAIIWVDRDDAAAPELLQQHGGCRLLAAKPELRGTASELGPVEAIGVSVARASLDALAAAFDDAGVRWWS